MVVPSTPRLARSLLVSAIRDPDPVIFLEPTRAYRSPREEVPEDVETFPLGMARIVQEGDDLTLMTWEPCCTPACRRSNRLRRSTASTSK